MDKQKRAFDKIFITLCVILCAMFLFSFFASHKQITYSATNKLMIDLGGYQAGTWSNEDVTVSATVSAGVEESQVFYAINSQLDEDFVEYQGEFVVTDEGGIFKNDNFVQFKIRYKAFEQTVTEYSDLIKINIDKKKPVIEKIEVSEQDFTQEPVSVKIFLADSSIYKQEYRAIIFEKEFEPLEEYLTKGMIVFEFITERNTVLNVGDIILIDQANNQTVYDKKIVINNIENTAPDFHLNLLNGKNQGEKYIEIKLGYIHSDAKEVLIQLASGKTESLPIKQVQKIKIKENGTYIIKVVSNAGNVYTRGIIVNDIKTMPIYFISFIILVVVLGGISVFVARLIIIRNKTIVIIKKKKN